MYSSEMDCCFLPFLPGLMLTSAVFYHVLHFFHMTVHIRDVCVFLAPFFSSLTVLVTYHLTKELKVGLGLGRGVSGRCMHLPTSNWYFCVSLPVCLSLSFCVSLCLCLSVCLSFFLSLSFYLSLSYLCVISVFLFHICLCISLSLSLSLCFCLSAFIQNAIIVYKTLSLFSSIAHNC